MSIEDESKPKSGEAAEPVRESDGVDVSLIRWMLSLTPSERLTVLNDTINGLEELRHARRQN
jgi:hypothetical protein